MMETIGSAAHPDLTFLAHYQQQCPFDLDDDRFVRLHEWFLRELSTIERFPDLDGAQRASYRRFCSRAHKRYLGIKEAQESNKLLSLSRNMGSSTAENLAGFGRSVYDRVRDLKKLVNFSDCENAVMVGSGGFPATLLWLRDNFPRVHYIGLDLNPDCVKIAAELVRSLGIDNIHFTVVDGRHYDFVDADFVYVANHVVPKRTVLEQIARSSSVRQVVVREPTSVGELLAEAVRPNLPAGFVADATGAAGGIMSYDLLLRRG